MNILVLGATGRVGSEVARLALQDGHHVTAFVRSPEKVQVESEYLTIFQGNVLQQEDLFKVMKGIDVVVSALNTDGGYTLSNSMPHIIKAMEREGVKRIVTVATAGILQSRVEPSVFRYQSSESKRTNTRPAEDHREAYEYLVKSSLQWTVVCPTYLPDGECTGVYRLEKEHLPIDGAKITVGDTAHFTYKQITSNEFLNVRVGLAY